MKENALKGKWNGGQIPFGYMVKDSYLAIDETLVPIVRKLFEMCADGITVKDIHKYIQAKGILRPNGKKITYSSLRYLLSNRVYIGEYRHSGIVHENVVPAIVDKEVYDRAQEQISRTAHAPARHKAEDDYLLTLNVICANGQHKILKAAELNVDQSRNPISDYGFPINLFFIINFTINICFYLQ